MEKQNNISWQSLYDLEVKINEPIGVKERFIELSNLLKQLQLPKNKGLHILDGGGSNVTSMILKIIFPDSFIVSVNIDGNNNAADVSLIVDLANYEKILQASNVPEFDLIFLGEVFEHLVKPYSTVVNLLKLLRTGGILIITTPNLANIYNRILLLLGKPLYNYRPLGILPYDDHITLATKKQMINLLHDTLNLEICAISGYSYCERKICVVPENPYARSGIKFRYIRYFLNKILPLTFKEGLLYIARKVR